MILSFSSLIPCSAMGTCLSASQVTSFTWKGLAYSSDFRDLKVPSASTCVTHNTPPVWVYYTFQVRLQQVLLCSSSWLVYTDSIWDDILLKPIMIPCWMHDIDWKSYAFLELFNYRWWDRYRFIFIWKLAILFNSLYF